MKNLLQFLILLIFTLSSNFLLSQDIEADGDVIMKKDLSVGGGNITLVNDVTDVDLKVVSIANTSGEFSIRTLGTPGGVLTLQRDGGLLLENDANSKVVEFDVPDAGGFRLNDGAGGTARFMINPNGTMAVGTTSFDSQSRMVLKQGPNDQRALLLEDDAGEFWTVNVDNLGDYNWRHRNNIALAGGVYIDASDSYTIKNFSDRRLKSDIERINPVLEKVLKLQAKKYFFNGMAKKSNKKSLGFIAQEVEELFPELVSEKDGYKALAYSNFGILAIKAIQEQQQIIEEFRQRIEQLEKK